MTADSATSLFSVLTVAASTPPGTIAELTKALERGSEQAFREFHAGYAGRLLRYALTIARGDIGLSEEAVQMALVRIASKVRRFPDEEAFWAWLACVVRSCVIDCARRNARYSSLLAKLRGEAASEPSSDEVDRAFSVQLEAVLATLCPDDRELLTAKYERGESTAALAATAGCSPKAMESRLGRLRQRVRDLVLANLSHET